jgi:hypothetical protein
MFASRQWRALPPSLPACGPATWGALSCSAGRRAAGGRRCRLPIRLWSRSDTRSPRRSSATPAPSGRSCERRFSIAPRPLDRRTPRASTSLKQAITTRGRPQPKLASCRSERSPYRHRHGLCLPGRTIVLDQRALRFSCAGTSRASSPTSATGTCSVVFARCALGSRER